MVISNLVVVGTKKNKKERKIIPEHNHGQRDSTQMDSLSKERGRFVKSGKTSRSPLVSSRPSPCVRAFLRAVSSGGAGVQIRLRGLDGVEQRGRTRAKLFLGSATGRPRGDSVALGGHMEEPCQPGHKGQHSCLLNQRLLKGHRGQSPFHILAFNSVWPLQELSLEDAE